MSETNTGAAAGGAVLEAPGLVMPDRRPGRQYTLSIDTGGTFTDGFVSDGERSAQVKVDTTPHDLTVGFQACVEASADAVGEELASFLSSLSTFHFSSTIATNTAVERRGARVGLIVSPGATESLYASKNDAMALLDFLDPELVRAVTEEVDADGRVVTEPDATELEAAVRELLERGVRLLVISFANAHLNPANELRARDIIDRSYPRHYLGAVPLMISSRISLAPSNHGRTAVAVINAYLHPNLVRALYRAEDQTRERGMRRPLLIVNTDGSSSRVAKTRAIDTYNSGPSAGVLGATYVARALGARHVCTFDVGGTTTDVAHVAAAEVPRDEHTDIGAAAIPHPAVALWSFGLGGGSIIRATDGGLQVGPQSAGSSPGPACFGLGGTDLTPTDVWLLLGYLEPGEFLGGRRTLDAGRAEVVASGVAERLGVGVEDAMLQARTALRRALTEQMRAWAKRQGGLLESPPEERWLFSYGGGGGLLAADAADALDIGRVVVFPHSSVFSAFGGGLLPIAHHYQAVVPVGSPGRLVDEALARLADNARRDLRSEGITELGQVAATVTVGGLTEPATTLREVLDRRAQTAEALDVVARVRLDVSVPRDARIEMLVGADTGADGTREIVTEDGRVSVPVIGGLGTADAQGAEGPAFLEAPDTTIFVPDGWSIAFTEQGYGVLTNLGRQSR
jgi:N-methylhydantoinase A/acetophenone carboxylase